MDGFIEIGRILKAHGIRGEICIEYNADSPELLGNSIYLAAPQPQGSRSKKMPLKQYILKSLRMHKGRPLITLEGVPDRTAAELLRGQSIFIPEDRLPELSDDEIYMNELPGLAVFVRENDNSLRRLGELLSADIMAEQEVWTIVTSEGQEILFPATEEFVESIDLSTESIIITPPPGLIEIYTDPGDSKNKQ